MSLVMRCTKYLGESLCVAETTHSNAAFQLDTQPRAGKLDPLYLPLPYCCLITSMQTSPGRVSPNYSQ